VDERAEVPGYERRPKRDVGGHGRFAARITVSVTV
jgi:hypothetical protein